MLRFARLILIGILLGMIGCISAEPTPTNLPQPTPTLVITEAATNAPPPTTIPQPTLTKTLAPTNTPAPTPTNPPTPTPTPEIEQLLFSDEAELVNTVQGYYSSWSSKENKLLFTNCPANRERFDSEAKYELNVFDAVQFIQTEIEVSEYDPDFCRQGKPNWMPDGNSVFWYAPQLFRVDNIYGTDLDSLETWLLVEFVTSAKVLPSSHEDELWVHEYAGGGHVRTYRLDMQTVGIEEFGFSVGWGVLGIGENYIAIDTWFPETNANRSLAVWLRTPASSAPQNAKFHNSETTPFTQMWTPVTDYQNSEFLAWIGDTDQMIVRAWNSEGYQDKEQFEEAQKAIFLWNVATGEIEPVFENEPQMRVSTAGIVAYFEDALAEITILNLNTPERQFQIAAQPDHFYWASDTMLAFTTIDGQLAIFDSDTGKRTTITQSGGSLLRNAQVSFDGAYMSAIYCESDNLVDCDQTMIIRLDE